MAHSWTEAYKIADGRREIRLEPIEVTVEHLIGTVAPEESNPGNPKKLKKKPKRKRRPGPPPPEEKPTSETRVSDDKRRHKKEGEDPRRRRKRRTRAKLVR